MLFGGLGAGVCVFTSGMNRVLQLWIVESVHVIVQTLRFWYCFVSPYACLV